MPGRIVAGIRLEPSKCIPGAKGGGGGANRDPRAALGVGDLVKWPAIGNLFGVGAGGGGEWEVRVYVLSARGLAAEDTNRKSDAYLEVYRMCSLYIHTSGWRLRIRTVSRMRTWRYIECVLSTYIPLAGG